jgi:ribosome-binding factor A
VKRPSHRPEQVAETIRQVIAEALTREVRDPRLGRVAVTSVTVSGDLAHARVRVVAGGEAADADRALAGLKSAAGYLRTKVARVLATRTVPELAFEIDRDAEHAARIDALLASLREGGEA